MKCATHNCENEATAATYWPGQPRKNCAACTVKLQNMATAMGFTLSVEPLQVYEPPTLTALGEPPQMKTSALLRGAAELLEPFAWGKPIADELRARAGLVEGVARQAEATCSFVHRMGCTCDTLRTIGEVRS